MQVYTITQEMLTPGVRVIRGFDWAWGDQDGGLGGVGTVCEIGMPGSKRSPDKTVVVNWDYGIRSNYRTGYQGSYDLIILDNAQCGVYHPDIECSSCKQKGIVGIRYQCSLCRGIDLCSLCYHNDKHNLEHSFLRYDTAGTNSIPLSPRHVEKKLCVRGIFSGATVQRGHDWKWDMQDGGEGRTGYVTEICNWGNESRRSVARVTWHNGYKNDYRVGHKGIMDLKYAKPSLGGYYYINHLPIFGKRVEAREVTAGTSAAGTSAAAAGEAGAGARCCAGDRVKVMLDVETLKSLQQGHGGWNSRMAEYIGKVGIVHRITDRGDVRVQYEGCANRWTFHPGALERVGRGSGGGGDGGGGAEGGGAIGAGDEVQLTHDGYLMRRLQRHHSDWTPAMEKVLGKTGRVMNIYHDGDLRVQICDGEHKTMWTVNPQCVKLLRRANPAEKANFADLENQSQKKPEQGLADRPELRLLMSKVAQGNLEYVREIREKDPSLLDTPFCGKTALQVAAYQGHGAVARELLAAGARVVARDDDGDTALHDAAFGNQPEILEILLNHPDVDINTPNRSYCTALHIASHKCLPHCVTVLLNHNPDINIQDTYGDTALHDAINYQCGGGGEPATATLLDVAGANVPPSSSHRIIQMLCDHPGIDFTVSNKRGFNVLQHAALKGNAFACAAVCRRAPPLVDVAKDDGFSALHLAALNGHSDAVRALIQVGNADLNLRNNRQQTPLLLAISQGHAVVIELLVTLGCTVTAVDEDGNTALHIVMLKRANMQSEACRPSSTDCPGIYNTYEKLASEQSVGANRLACAIVLFLIIKGCDPDAKNKDNKTCFDLLTADTHLIQIIKDRIASLGEEVAGAVGQLSGEGDVTNIESPMAEVSLTERAQSSGEASARPNSTRALAFSGPEDNVNQSPMRRNYNLNQYNQLGGIDWSSHCSPVHVARGLNKPTSTSDGSPARPARSRQPRPPPTPSRTKPVECMVCCELSEENVQLEPCGHRVACEDCAGRMKKCLVCSSIIERRVTVDGRVLACRSRQPSAERLRYLEGKIQEMEETHGCPICMERRRSVAFLCGHQACTKCAATLTTCHMCRQPITTKINLY